MLAQRVEQVLKVCRWWRFQFELLVCHGMQEFQARGMQRLPAEFSKRLDKSVTGRGRQRHATAIDWVADKRVAPVCEMHTNLVCSSGFKLDTYICVRLESFEHAIPRYGRFSFFLHTHAQSIDWMAGDRRVDGTATGQDSVADGEILSGNFPRRQHAHEGRMRLQCLADEQEAAGIFVESVNDAGSR